MKKGKILLFLVLVIVALFASNCVKQPPLVVPAAPAGLRVVQLAGGDVELRWDAVAGAASYDVTIDKVAGSGSRETFGPYNTTNTYYVARKSVIGTGNFNWSVLAKNAAGSSPAATGTFDIPADPVPDPVYELQLTLVEEPAQGSAVPTIYTVGAAAVVGERLPGVSALNYLKGNLKREEIPAEADRAELAVQFLVQKVGASVAKRWPNDSTEYVFDEDGELNFNLCNLGEGFSPVLLAPGEYYLWARAVWDGSESQKVPFKIVSRNSDLNYEITVKDLSGNEYEGRVCSYSSTDVTLEFSLSITGGEAFKQLRYSLEIGPTGSSNDESTSKSATFVNTTSWSTKVLFEAECTKSATLTVAGTFTAYSCDGATVTKTDESVEILKNVGINFVLDMKDPTALVTVDPYDLEEEEANSIKTATLTFLASDTKCLDWEHISFKVQVFKGIGDWKDSWEYGKTKIVLGEDSGWDNELTITATYSATKTDSTEINDAKAILVFDIKDLDLAIIITTMNASDCCCLDCTLVDPCAGCNGGSDLTHATNVSVSMLVDNVFFSSMLKEDEVLQIVGLKGDKVIGGKNYPTIPASPAVATVTLILADANWDPENALDSNSQVGFSLSATTSIQAVCSGYATKTQATYIATLTAIQPEQAEDATETVITVVGTATDDADNVFSLTRVFWYDTMPPTLTHFAAFRNPSGANGSYIEFSFHEEPVSAELTLEITGQGTFTYTLAQATAVTGHLNTYRLSTGISLSEGADVKLTAKAKDLAGNVGTSSWETEVSPSAPR